MYMHRQQQVSRDPFGSHGSGTAAGWTGWPAARWVRNINRGYLVGIAAMALAFATSGHARAEAILETDPQTHASGVAEKHEAIGNTDTDRGVVDPATAGLRIEWTSTPVAPRPGETVTFSYRLVDVQSGEMVTNVLIGHERPMHLILVSQDLAVFQHIHPELDATGSYRITTTLPRAGMYLLYDEFRHDGHTILDQRELVVGEGTPARAELATDLSPKTGDAGITVALNAPEVIRAEEEAHFTFALARDGQPVTDLTPYLGAAAHVAIVSEDSTDFAHTHGEAGALPDEHSAGTGDEHGDHSLPATFGPEVRFTHTFPTPGHYKIWAQFQSGNGQVVSVSFVVEVR